VRGSAFDTPDSESPGEQQPAAPELEPASETPSGEWRAATAAIASDMRAHLERRAKVCMPARARLRPSLPEPTAPLSYCSQRAEADLIVQNRGLIKRVAFGLGDFLRSRYFANVRKSIGIFVGMWFWYVLNTKTYIPPEFEE
jgi:hypothetical protein